MEGPTDDEPNVVLPPPPSHGKRAARGSKQEGSASVPPSRSFEDMLRTVVGSSESELTETSTPGMHHRVNLSGKLASGASDNKGDAEQVNIDDSGVGALRPASTPSDSTPRSLSMAATGQLVQLESHVATADDPASKEASPVALHSEEEEEEEDERSALYTAVNKAWKTPKKKSPKLSQVESPSPTAEDSSEGRASASSGAEMEQLDSAAASGRSSQTKFTPPVVKPKPRRPPPPRPVPFAEHMKKLSSSPANVGKSEILPPTGSLVELEQDAGMFEVVGNKDGVGPQGRTTLGRLTSSQKHGSKEKPPPISAKPAGRGHERVGGVKLPGLEKMGADVGVGEIKTTVAGMKARGHQRTASLDSKKEELGETLLLTDTRLWLHDVIRTGSLLPAIDLVLTSCTDVQGNDQRHRTSQMKLCSNVNCLCTADKALMVVTSCAIDCFLLHYCSKVSTKSRLHVGHLVIIDDTMFCSSYAFSHFSSSSSHFSGVPVSD